MLGVALAFDLQALICQMHLNVLVFEIIFSRASSQITMLVEENTIIVSDDSPHSHIKFTPIKQKWMLNILLDHP